MIRILARFGLSHPCSAPLDVVAHSNMHAMLLLSGIRRVSRRARHEWENQALTPAEVSVCQQLYLQHVISKEMVKAMSSTNYGMVSADLRHSMETIAHVAAPQLAAVFHSFGDFEVLSEEYED